MAIPGGRVGVVAQRAVIGFGAGTWTLLLMLALACGAATAAEVAPRNLALAARASAFEEYQGMAAGLANDGSMETRWSGIPGHNTGGWYELAWDQSVRIGEIIVFQHDRYVKEMDVQIWDEATQVWITLQHLGQPSGRLPKVVICRFPPRSTKRLRLGNITNGPSFAEVEVFEAVFSHPAVVSAASDLNGGLIGMVCDAWGSAPVVDAEVLLAGQAASGPWTASVRSDPHGLFFAAMPLGVTGQLTITARPCDLPDMPAITNQVDATGLQYGLTPENLRRRDTSLDGQWRFTPDPPENFWKPEFDDSRWAAIRVPAHFEMEGFRSLEGVGGYRKRFVPPRGEGRLKLRFEGVYSGAEVWVNGRRVAYHEGGALPFEVDVTDVAREGDNLLAVRVTQHTVVSDQLDKMSEYADFPLAGIMRSVRLFRVASAHVGALAVSTTFDAAFRKAALTGRVAVLNESAQPLANGTLELRLTDPEGKPVPLNAQPLAIQAGPWQRAEVEFSLPVSAPRPWEAEHPHRYTLELTLKAGARVIEELAQRIGFRQTDLRDRQLLINGRPVKIRGACHHDSHPLLGRAVTAELTRQDLELMKEANLNSLRTSHYPPHPALLEVADELGIYVEDEGSFCWADATDDLRLTPRVMQLNAELLARDRNHPSVFIWSVCNESAFGFGFERSHEWLRKADPSRPNAGSYDRGSLEILARHNPICQGDITELEKVNKPVLWDECWCIFQGIFGDIAEMWVDPGLRDYYAEPLPAVYARMMRSKNIIGTQIWAWSDDIFCVPNRGLEYGREGTRCHFLEEQYRLPNRGLVGDAPWGVVDGWRRRKPEFWITQKLHSPVKIKEAPLLVPASGQALRVAVENQYDFTDLSELEIRWEVGTEKGQARVSVAPHSSGEIEIQPQRQPKEGEALALEFLDARGRRVDAYRLSLGPAPPPVPPVREANPTPLRIARENLLAGQGTRLVGRDFELSFDQRSGRLRRGVAFGQALLLDLPALHVLPAATPMSALPNQASWHLRGLEVKPEGTDIRVRIRGGYDHFEGAYDVLVSPAGEMVVRSSFKYTGEKLLAREMGLAFAVPKDCDLLRWQRQGEWSVYPKDHLGRLLGETRAFARHADTLPPTWPWAEDNSPMGCNDFRSTKRHLQWASIAYPEGPGLRVESDGTQHLRASVETDRIVMRINDWYGGTHAGLWEWTSNYGEGKPIESSQTIESTARLRIVPAPKLSKL